ncbi:iron ABC transporter permease [Actinocorallia sp. A-T 12471]|uniref:FecCD family ABC transporter permease n=1 Tax=Actinocorallia sp. A-T 12471 TaxID=3089813 RepID=UPI0029D28247|nr:iron ABC transporter permease [Actinocorallia sp. A-T 12471]MDX6739276.1 iron ABC transporter permease [Actinocorallia sp. A-T 12471]
MLPRARLRPAPLAVTLAVLAASLAAGLLAGAIALPPGAVLRAVAGLPSGLSEMEQALVLELRLPRVLLGALVGGLLALAGAGYQGVLRNPLADPYLLGSAAGAGLGATLVILYVPIAPWLGVPVAAFAGALGGVALAYALGRAAGPGTGTLILAGVAVSSFLSAVQTFLQQSRIDDLHRVYSWILGGLSGASWQTLAMIAPYALLSTVVLLLHGRLLDVLAVGDDEASALGVNAGQVRFLVLAAASLATASAVAVSGLIGFVGIVVPHLVRLLAGGSFRVVLPLSFLGGAAFLVLADLLARTVVAPGELPLGVVTAFVGAPFFLAVLRSSRGRSG